LLSIQAQPSLLSLGFVADGLAACSACDDEQSGCGETALTTSVAAGSVGATPERRIGFE
jgi:hypothetical protein